jgi:hypothetical protein
MKRTLLWLSLSLIFALQGCPDDDPAAPVSEDTSTDAADVDSDDAGDSDDASDGDDTSDSDVAEPPELRCFIGLETGFESLSDLTLTENDERELYRQSPGFQVDFRAEGEGVSSGTPVELSLGGTVFQTLGVDAAGEVRFENVTLPAGTTAVDLSVTVGGQEASCGATVTVQTGTCDVELLPALDTCLTGSGGTSTVQKFTVNNPNELCDSALLVYRIDGVEQTTDSVPLVAGTAEISVELFDSLVDLETVEVKAQVRSGEFASLTAETDYVTFEVDSAPPVPTITSLVDNAQLGLASDLNSDLSDGVQVQLQGAVGSPDVATITVTTESGQVIAPVLNGDNWVADLDFLSDVSGDTIQVTVGDSCGNQGTAQVSGINVSVQSSALTILSPLPGTLLAISDGDPSTTEIFETSFVVTATSLSTPTSLEVRCSPDFDQIAPVLAGTLQVTAASVDDTYTIDNVSIDTTGGLNTWQCRVVDAGINPTESGVVDLIVGLPAPTLSLTSPSSNVVSELQYDLSGLATNLEGQFGQITLNTAAGDTVYTSVTTDTSVSGGGFTFATWLTSDGTPQGASVIDGEYLLSFDISDQFGNDACVTDASQCEVSIRLDTVAPVISLQAPMPGNLDPAVLPDSGAAAGYQTTVTVAVDELGYEAGTEVCLNAGGFETCIEVADGATSVDFANVTLQPGANTLELVATDLAGNVSGVLSETVTLLSDAPVITFISPTSDTSTATPEITVVVSVSTIDGASLAGANVIARIDGVASNAVPSYDSVSGNYTFTDLVLPGFGVFGIQVEGSVGGGTTGATGTLQINVKDGPPTLAFSNIGVSPSTLNLSSSVCAPGQSDCVLTVVCTSTNLDDGSVASLSWQCGGGGLQQAIASVSSSAASFENVVLSNNSTCTLSCDATDLGTGQAATSDPFQVVVDRTAPVLGPYLQPENNSLIFVDDESPDAGFQYSPQIRAQGVEAGQIVTLDITSEQGTVQLQQAVPSSISDSDVATIFFAQSTLPQGTATFTATVSDAAGNTSAPLVKTVSVQSEAPLVRISQPTYISPDACTTDDDCGAGLCVPGGASNVCATAWGLASDRSLLVKTQNIPGLTLNQVRVCSDNPAYVGNQACDTSGAGFYEVKTVPLVGEQALVDLANLAEGSHMLIAEAQLNDTGTLWATSLTASTEADRMRSVSVDVTAPLLSDFSVPANAMPTDCLSAAEGDSGSYDFSATCNENGQFAVTANSLPLVSGPISAATATDFSDVPLTDAATVNLSATCSDRYGNVSTAVLLPIAVDTVAPTVVISSPLSSPVVGGQSLDVSVASDAIGQNVTLNSSLSGTFGPVAVGDDGVALFDDSTYSVLTDGTHILTASVSDTCGNVAQTTSGALVVDTTAPIVALGAPANGASLVDSDDASTDGGFQVAVGFSTVGDASMWEIRLETACAADFTGCQPSEVVASGSVTNAGGAEPTQVVTVPVATTPDYLILTVAVMDAVGNVATVSNNLTITLSACTLSFGGLASGPVGNSACATPNADCASADLTYSVQLVGACGGVTSVDLYEGGALATSAAVSGASATFTRTYAHNTDTTLEARGSDAQGGEISTGQRTLLVDLVSPVAAFVATDVNGFTTPASGATVNYSEGDDQGGADGLQINVAVDVSDDGLGDGTITSLTAGGTPISSAPSVPVGILGTSFSVDFTNVTLPEATDSTVELEVQDAAGNTATTTFTYSADITAPAPLAVTLDSFNRRRPSVTLSWTSPADGVELDVRYSLSPISEVSFDSACQASAIPGAASYPTPSGGADTYTVSGPDTRDPSDPCHFIMRTDDVPYYFAVRIRDAAGNWSPIGPTSVVSSTDLRLRFAQVSVDDSAYNSAHDDDYDKRISPIGDINNDGFADFALGGNTSYGNCIFYGSAQATIPTITASPDFTSNLAGAEWQCLFDNDGLGNPVELRAGHIAQNIGDVNGDGLQDLGVPFGKNNLTPTRSIRIYFGVNGGQISPVPDVIVGGHAPFESSTTTRFAGGGDFNNDQIDDLVLGSRRNGNGEAYVLPGSNAWTSGLSIDLSDQADLDTWNVQKFEMPVAVTTPRFGAQVGFVGDVLGNDGYDDIVVMAENPTENTQAVIFRGRETLSSGVFDVSYTHDGSGTEDATSVQLLPEAGAKNNFGASNNILSRDVTGDSVPDIIIAHSKSDSNDLRFYVFDGAAVGNADGGTLTINPDVSTQIGDGMYASVDGSGFVLQGPFINVGSLGNITDTSDSDVAAVAYARADDTGATKVYIRFNLDRGAAEPLGSFSRVDMSFTDPFDSANQSFVDRDVVGIGDFNGDGLDDFVISTTSGYAVIAY